MQTNNPQKGMVKRVIVAVILTLNHPTLGGEGRISGSSTQTPSVNCPVDNSTAVKPLAPASLANPIPERVVFGKITVRTEEFVQLPKTEDVGVEPGRFNAARARVQGLVPVPDRSGRLAIIDQRGKVYLIDADGGNLSVYLDLIEQDVGFNAAKFPIEMGLMSIAFHPDFARRRKPGYGKFYTAYTASSNSGVANYHEDASKSHEDVIREWTTDRPRHNRFKGVSREILRVGQSSTAHNIGKIGFNPAARKRRNPDYGMLYAGMGDGGEYYPLHTAQSLLSPLGALLRIDPLGDDDERAYGIPDDNPFVGRDDALPEIWVYGNRHPQHLSWDFDGRMFFAEIGAANIEEVNLGVAGANYGWPLREGNFATWLGYEGGRRGSVYPLPEYDAHGFTGPIAQYDHDEGRAIGGGYVYRGKNIPTLRGKYVFSDLQSGRLFYIDTDDVAPGRPRTVYELRVDYDGRGSTLLEVAGMHDNRGRRVDLRLGRDGKGEIYLLTKSDGKVRRLFR